MNVEHSFADAPCVAHLWEFALTHEWHSHPYSSRGECITKDVDEVCADDVDGGCDDADDHDAADDDYNHDYDDLEDDDDDDDDRQHDVSTLHKFENPQASTT